MTRKKDNYDLWLKERRERKHAKTCVEEQRKKQKETHCEH